MGYPYLDIHEISTLGYPWDVLGYPYLAIHTWISMGHPYLDIGETFGYPMDIHRIFQISRAPDLDSDFKFALKRQHRSQIHRSKIHITKFIIQFPAQTSSVRHLG